MVQFIDMNITEVLGKLHDFIPQSVLFAFFGLICLVFAITSFVLIYHWNKYAIDKSSIVTAQSIYFIGVAFILLLAFLSVILY